MLGYPGAGKTTTAQVIHKLTGAEHIWADHERRKRFGAPTFSHAENQMLYNDLNAKTNQFLAEGKSVIFDTNFNLYKDRERLRGFAAKHGVNTVIVWVSTPREIARERATKGAILQDTRLLGDYSQEEFDRQSRKLEPPRQDEAVIEVDGTKVTDEYIQNLLAQNEIMAS